MDSSLPHDQAIIIGDEKSTTTQIKDTPKPNNQPVALNSDVITNEIVSHIEKSDIAKKIPVKRKTATSATPKAKKQKKPKDTTTTTTTTATSTPKPDSSTVLGTSSLKRIPNIAEELAMNRNNAKTVSPSPTLLTASTTTKEANNVKKEPVKPKLKTDSSAKAVGDKKLKQVKISSLLSSSDSAVSTSTPNNKPASSTSIIQKALSTTSTSTTIATKTTATKDAPKKKVTNKPALKRSKSNTSTAGVKKLNSTTTTGSTLKATKSKSVNAIESATKKKPKKVAPTAVNVTEKKKQAETQPAVPPPQPEKFVPAPAIKEPNVLSSVSNVKSTSVSSSNDKNSKISIIDIPLYSTASNEYLDENGTVTFNLFKLLKDQEQSNLQDEKTKKRTKLISEELNVQTNYIGTDADEEDISMVGDDNDEVEEEDENNTKSDAQPKKKSHPMKGKNLIGKYDFEDPFIDDTEMLWEEQRASTKDGFFVFFGPLIAKGQSASFERINGTMKRGGIKK